MKQGMSYTSKEKTIILNVFKYFRNQYPDKCVTDIVRRTAKATGCSEKSVFQFRKEENSTEGFKEPSKTKIRKNININSRDIKYDNVVRSTIRNIIYDLQFKNIVPSLNTILKQISVNKQMPKFSVMTLRRLMFDMGFSYQKNGNKFILIEKPDNRLLQPNQNHNEMQHQNKSIIPQQIQQPLHNNHHQDLSPMIPTAPPPPPPDPRISHPNPIHMAPIPPGLMHEDHLMGPPPPVMLHTNANNMIHKSMPPPMMMNSRRDMMPPGPPPPMDMHRKRDSMAPWMHGIIKEGQ